MLPISDAALAVLTGSWTPQLAVDAYYDGDLILSLTTVDPAAVARGVAGGSVSEDVTRDTIGTGSLSAASVDATLIPTSWDSPLACYGSQLHIRVGIPIPGQDAEWISLGWFVIEDFDTQEWWQQYLQADGTVAWVSRGTVVQVNFADRWLLIDQAVFAVPEQPAQLASAKTELARLVDGIVPVEDWTPIADVAIPNTLTYSDSRSQAVQGLAGLLGCTARVSRDGGLALTPASSTPVWAVSVGEEQAARIVQVGRRGNRDGLANQFVSTGTSTGGTPVQGSVTTTSGPLRFGGPLGRIPVVNDNPLVTTWEAAAADASAQQDIYGGAQTVLIPVTVPFNPALEVGDVLTVNLPDLTLAGPVATIERTFAAATMDVTVKVSRSALWGFSG